MLGLDQNRTLAFLIFLTCLFISLSAYLGVSYVKLNQSYNRYFATTKDGEIVPLYSLDQTYITDKELKNWAIAAVLDSFNYSYADYRQRLEHASRFYTPRGWESFAHFLQDFDGLDLKVTTAKKCSALTYIEEDPVVEETSVIHSRRLWRVSVVVRVDYSGCGEDKKFRINLLVARSPRLESPYGIGIEQWSAKKTNAKNL